MLATLPALLIPFGAGSLLAGPPLPAPVGWVAPDPAPETPGPDYAPPIDPKLDVPDDAPHLSMDTAEAGPDQTFLAVGDGLTGELYVWGRDEAAAQGRKWDVKTYLSKEGYVAATLPDRSFDAPFLVWAANEHGWSRPIRLNVPQAWWCYPHRPTIGSVLRVFGRDLARRPDDARAFCYLNQPGQPGVWLETERVGRYELAVDLPVTLKPGSYQLWVHAGAGGQYGWSAPLAVSLAGMTAGDRPDVTVDPGQDVQAAIDGLHGPGIVMLSSGVYPFHGTLRVPAGVTVSGTGSASTTLQLQPSRPDQFARVNASSWNSGPGRIHSVGDRMIYDLDVPTAGTWQVWLRYATEMSPWDQPGVSGNHTLQVGDGEPVPLENLPNTGSFSAFKWSRSATLELPQGKVTITWQNAKGGGINLDAFVFASDPDYTPTDDPWPASGPGVIVRQAEDVSQFITKEGSLPGATNTLVWLSGDGAAVKNLTIAGSPQASTGVLIQSPEPLGWVKGCRVTDCRVVDLEGKGAEICGVKLAQADAAVVRDNALHARAPIWLAGVRHCEFADNELVPHTRYSNNALAAIVGRTDVVEQCVIEHNVVVSPRGAEAGGPQVMRLIWLSTGRGSITRNWLAHNGTVDPNGPGAMRGAGPMRFGGVAGHDQNVGEMILFEGNHRTMYFGPLAGADAQSVTLPKTLPDTPDERLGSVKREQLAHDADGNETPFWPPNELDTSDEPPLGEYYVSVFKGRGQGQTRRVVKREGERLLLDRPWRVPPTEGSVVAIGTAFYQNLIVDNYTSDGMTGIQLWISCVENVCAGNSIVRMRKPGFFLYSNGTTLASSMPRTWNRGISPLFFNTVEGNLTDECSAGALVTSGDAADLPIEFPRALGNVLRANSFVKSRTDGVIITSRKGEAANGDTSASILGTLVEFNVVRDAPTAYHLSHGGDGVVFRRNHAYFWYPVNNSTAPPVAFKIDPAGADVAIDQNTVEGIVGSGTKDVVQVERPEEK